MIKSKSRLLLVILVIIIAISALFLFACDFGDSNENSEQENQEEIEIIFCNMDEDLIVDDISYRVYDAAICKSIPSTSGGKIKTDNYFMYLKIRITNNSKSSKSLYLGDFTLISPSGSHYEPTDYIFMYNRMKNAKLGAGFTEKYYIVFEIPHKEYDGDYKLSINEYFWFWNTDPYIIIDDWYGVYGEE